MSSQVLPETAIEANELPHYYVSKYRLLALGLTATVFNTIDNWNYGLQAGLGWEVFFNVLAALAFLFFYSCTSELTSTIPFPGGCYAFARCTIGYLPGFMSGAIEMVYFVLTYTVFNASIVYFITMLVPSTKGSEALMVILVVIFQFCGCFSKNFFYGFMVACSAFMVMVALIYVFGAMPYADLPKWGYLPRGDMSVKKQIFDDDGFNATTIAAKDGTLTIDNSFAIIQAFQYPVYLYMGLEYVSMMCDDVKQPRKDIPFVQLTGVAIVTFFNTLIPILGASMAPGIDHLSSVLTPLSPGWAHILKIRHIVGLWLIMPHMFGCSTANLYAATKLMVALAESKLVPSAFSWRACKTQTPIVASVFIILVSLVILGIPGDATVSVLFVLANTASVCCLLVYCIQIIGYISLRWKLSRFEREFRSPFGVPGAIFALIIFVVAIVSCMMDVVVAVPTIEIIAFYVALMLIYYFAWARYKQTFSEAENQLFLRAHVEIKEVNEYLFARIPLFGYWTALIYNDQKQLAKYGRLLRLTNSSDQNQQLPNNDQNDQIISGGQILMSGYSGYASSLDDGAGIGVVGVMAGGGGGGGGGVGQSQARSEGMTSTMDDGGDIGGLVTKNTVQMQMSTNYQPATSDGTASTEPYNQTGRYVLPVASSESAESDEALLTQLQRLQQQA